MALHQLEEEIEQITAYDVHIRKYTYFYWKYAGRKNDENRIKFFQQITNV